MLQNGLNLFTCYTGEPFEKVVYPRAILQVCKESLDRYSIT